jgi:hypothetical protein
MVVRSAQKGRDDIQRIRDAMEGRKPVVTDFQQELIIKQANIIGEDGAAMVEDIEDAAASATIKVMPADVFKMVESCMASLERKVRIQLQSDAITREKEPERLKQLEAIREQATMLHGSRLNKDQPTEESVAKTMREAVIEYMAAVDQDKEDGLDPDTARLWKEQVQEIVTLANLDMPRAGTRGDGPEPASQDGATDCLAPLRDAIDHYQACQDRRGGGSCGRNRGAEAPSRRRRPGVHIQGSDGVHWHPPTMALQGVWEAVGERKGETDSGQPALPVLPPS